MLSNVDSCPPCSDDVEVNTAAGLSINAPDNHKSEVVSKKAFSAAAIVPKRVGEPRASPLHSSSSIFEMIGTFWSDWFLLKGTTVRKTGSLFPSSKIPGTFASVLPLLLKTIAIPHVLHPSYQQEMSSCIFAF